ncbi:uncharacterized protein BYT42DRAFT_590788 [Radiomyces spectabilis]|uniref:uncharacterized protein n=1 Tax=Radiomyces spectabilis TaxID=64574 RepID=UPI00222083FB|nr:uncharacterized protein BYT42DRAFT_590788 [Radiomyces spectabilis]KAI8364163.1 hypothetical protein BYT42DRAFT_590788 [Radiomyces spectabilis]
MKDMTPRTKFSDKWIGPFMVVKVNAHSGTYLQEWYQRSSPPTNGSKPRYPKGTCIWPRLEGASANCLFRISLVLVNFCGCLNSLVFSLSFGVSPVVL